MMTTSDTPSRKTLQNVNSKRRLQRIQNVQEGKRHYKKDTSKFYALCGKDRLLLFLARSFQQVKF
jgi:hypothetical protein